MMIINWQHLMLARDGRIEIDRDGLESVTVFVFVLALHKTKRKVVFVCP